MGPEYHGLQNKNLFKYFIDLYLLDERSSISNLDKNDISERTILS